MSNVTRKCQWLSDPIVNENNARWQKNICYKMLGECSIHIHELIFAWNERIALLNISIYDSQNFVLCLHESVIYSIEMDVTMCFVQVRIKKNHWLLQNRIFNIIPFYNLLREQEPLKLCVIWNVSSVINFILISEREGKREREILPYLICRCHLKDQSFFN